MPEAEHRARNSIEWKIQEGLIADLWNSRLNHPGTWHSFSEEDKQQWGETLAQYVDDLIKRADVKQTPIVRNMRELSGSIVLTGGSTVQRVPKR